MNTYIRYIGTGLFALSALGLTGCANTGETASAPAPSTTTATPTPTPTITEPEVDYDEIAEAKAEAAEEAEAVADMKTNDAYKDVAQDASDLFQSAIDAANDDDIAALIDLGPDFARVGLRGAALDDMPDQGAKANKYWDDAMSDMLVTGGALQTGMISMATNAMVSVGENIELAQAYMD